MTARGAARALLTLGLATALVFSICAPAVASAAPPPPTDLRVVNGDDWRARNGFDLRWQIKESAVPIAGVHYLVRSPLGVTVIGPHEATNPLQAIDNIRVPEKIPGAYTAEVWLEDTKGGEGAPAAIKLRFDPIRPGAVDPQQPAGWISRTELPYTVHLGHPQGAAPVSGIRGYAVSIDRVATASPCAGAELCADAETDLRGGIEDDELDVAELPEGISYVHALAVSGSQVSSLSPGHALLRVDRTDPTTRLSGVPEGWTNRPVTLEATATDSASGMVASGDGAPFTAIQVDGEVPIVSAGSAVRATVIAPGAHTISFYARDAAGNVDDGADANGRRNAAPATMPLRIDREAPTAFFTGSANPDEPELIEARVSDGLSGPAPGRGVIAVRDAGSGDPWNALPTFGSGEALLAHWRSDEYPVGEYEFRVTGYDNAGNSVTSSRRTSGSPMVLPNPLKARAILFAGFGPDLGAQSQVQVIAHGRTETYSGRLAATSDLSLGGRAVTVVERFDQGAAEPRRTTVIPTGADGSFSVQLPPGPSREVFATFGGTAAATGATSRPLRLGVRSGVRMQASSPVARVGGKPIVFRGSIAASPAELPSGGVTVQLQFRAAGLPWAEFRTVRTNALGRFRYAYRFSDDDSRGVRFRFRASTPAQSGWPYEPGTSKPVAVRGS